ncbi:hypothetical protein ACIRU3_46725, partial [Streptomyces sp. NPDC101151]|uniref:hypothetical protein n=1 Tax=Streptomyces sp. NPDC101151 TaxID=3366115 RepID=UPI0038258E72
MSRLPPGARRFRRRSQVSDEAVAGVFALMGTLAREEPGSLGFYDGRPIHGGLGSLYLIVRAALLGSVTFARTSVFH